MASISGIQTAAESEQIFTRPVKLLTEFLSGQFVHYVNRKGEYEPDMMGLNDDEERNYGVERVITTMNGDFILTSLYERDIDNFIKKEFPTTTLDISKFSGVTQEITDDEYDGGYYYRRRTFKIFITYEIALELFKKKVPNVRALFINESKTQKLKQS